jgi:hypothetical protein
LATTLVPEFVGPAGGALGTVAGDNGRDGDASGVTGQAGIEQILCHRTTLPEVGVE